MEEKICYGELSQEPSGLEIKNRALARQAAAEGFVLLKNDGGALPIENRKIALYGMGARKTVKGGLGSGSVEERCSVNIEDGLKNAGYKITTQSWLDDYDREYTAEYTAWHDMVEDNIKDLSSMPAMILAAHRYVFRYPSGRLITQADIDESDTDTAVYVIMRQAGEGNDRRLEPGDYLITDVERENLKLIGKAYAHTILVINIGGFLEMSFMDEIEGIDALVLFVQGGEEGGNALADVLSGVSDFSGRLAATIPMRYEDIPFSDKFSYLGGDKENSYYSEGIYVGYRYFDSFDKPVRYPFGYGLSYTSYEMSTGLISVRNGKVFVDVTVKNTGSFAGKQVVQLYVSPPRGSMDKEYQRLTAFAKTKELAPGRSQTLTLSFGLDAMASYDEAASAWCLDAGDYVLRVGENSRSTTAAAALRLSRRAVTVQCKSCMAPTDELPRFLPDTVRKVCSDGLPVVNIDPEMICTEVIDYTEPEYEETDEEKRILDGLTMEEQAQLLRGGDLQMAPKGSFDIAGAAGKTSTALLEKGLTNIIMSDGPAGLNIVNELYAMPDGTAMSAKIPERYNWGAPARQMAAQLAKIQAPKIYRYATAWPVSMLRAQTWNTELLEQIGDAVGQEMEEFGISVWLAPGMNIQKNPLGGRVFEYYSEDPLLSGELAAALTNGVQSHAGCSLTVKHFCCNNLEDNRTGVSANVSERALREIYLKGFEIAVKTAQPKTVMSSYNMVNHTYTPNSYDLLTNILRCEWGFEGLVMTDWGSCDEGLGDPALCTLSGNDLIMPGSAAYHTAILEAVQEGKLSPEKIRRSAARVLHLMLGSNTPVYTRQ